jgi:hypothetical protein
LVDAAAVSDATDAIFDALSGSVPYRGRDPSRGNDSTKIHHRAEGGGKPMTHVLTAGQRHEAPQTPTLLERGAVKRPGRGRPRIRPDRVVGDKGYTGTPVRS